MADGEESKRQLHLPENTASTAGFHVLKWIPCGTNGSFLPVVTQNENGPCPLVALCNVLILQNMIKLPAGETIVTTQRLLELLGSCLINCRPTNLYNIQGLNYEQNMDDAIATFPRLLTGLDVNVKFNSVDGFEFTQELSIFDLLGVHLYHGWLSDPSDTVTHPVVSTYSYNQLVEFAINNQTSDDHVKEQEALVAQQFLENTASQLTYHGLYELNRRVMEGELCVFFRNNHFNTLLKRNGQLMLLVTDFGFREELTHVWHLLVDIDDSGDFLDSEFRLVNQIDGDIVGGDMGGDIVGGGMDGDVVDNRDVPVDNNTRPECHFTTPPTSHSPTLPAVTTDIDRLDYEVAARLQAEEDGFSTDQNLALRLQHQEFLSNQHVDPHNPPPFSNTLPPPNPSPIPSPATYPTVNVPPKTTRQQSSTRSENSSTSSKSDACSIL